jgi:hypothetical protein
MNRASVDNKVESSTLSGRRGAGSASPVPRRRWWPLRSAGKVVGYVDPAWAPLLRPIFERNELEVVMPAMTSAGLLRLSGRQRLDRRVWRALRWLFGTRDGLEWLAAYALLVGVIAVAMSGLMIVVGGKITRLLSQQMGLP